ncbi:MAG TPA: ATP-dependent Clp protease proteolytic subunit [Pirellulales bacterium]|nr:ATP-dependent Clp protease proteolytic subunit [Pirellulales bacterium]
MPRNEPIPEIAFTGDLTERENDLTQHLLEVPPGGNCLLYFDSPGGNPYVGLSLMSLMLLRGVRATGIVTGECSSAALWPLAACRRRCVTPYSVLLFHPMKWQSEENVGLAEAAEWARHFGDLEKTMDELLAELFGVSRADMVRWMQPGRYLTGREIVEAGLAEMLDLQPLDFAQFDGAVRRRKQRN